MNLSEFNTDYVKLRQRMEAMLEELNDCSFYGKPCKLLIGQLEEAVSLSARFTRHASRLIELMKDNEA